MSFGLYAGLPRSCGVEWVKHSFSMSSVFTYASMNLTGLDVCTYFSMVLGIRKVWFLGRPSM